jgi:hypothetical protein
MPAKKYLVAQNGQTAERFATVVSTGAANGGDILAADDTGRLDVSVLPVGVGPDVASLPTTEALAAGDFVNLYSNAGAFAVRKADASAAGKEAHGYVLGAVTSGATATVYFDGRNTAVSGQSPGVVFLSATNAGKGTATCPTGAGQIQQRLGVAVAATELNFEATPPILLA